MKFDLSNIEMSKNDLRRGLKLPNEMSEELAEDIGIMIGDGNINLHIDSLRTNYKLSVSGNALTDYSYFSKYVIKLKKKLYNIDFRPSIPKKRKVQIEVIARSKGLLHFYVDVIGLPLGKKTFIEAPICIKNASSNIKKAFLRGYADTDGGIVLRNKNKNNFPYPLIKLSSSSKPLIQDVSNLLQELGLFHTVSYDLHSIHSKTRKESIINEIRLNGVEKVLSWSDLIGFSNQKNIEKIRIIKKRAHRDLNPAQGLFETDLKVNPFT